MQQKELAKLLDISPAMVCRLAKKGMPTDTLERAQRWRKRHIEPGRMKGIRHDPNRTTTLASVDQLPAAHNVTVDETDSSSPMSDLNDDASDEGFESARTRREIAEANLAEMKEAEERGELIRVDAVRAVLGRVFSVTRDTLLQIPSRLAATLAADADPASVQNNLHTEIHQALQHLAGASDALQTPAAQPNSPS